MVPHMNQASTSHHIFDGESISRDAYTGPFLIWNDGCVRVVTL